jgi:uncharacterized protein YfaS (alpha-2-macroglobulin family)
MAATPGGPGVHPRANRRSVSLALAMLLALAVGSPGLFRAPAGRGAAGASTPSSPAAANPSASSTGDTTFTAWSPVRQGTVAPVAELSATLSSPAGVATDTAFVLRGRSSSAVELARRLSVTPTLDLRTEPGPDAGSLTLRPAAPLEPGAQYRFELRLADGSTAGSWAFQAQSPPRVATTLPDDGAINVPTDSGIELTFDQDGVGDGRPFFSIAPAVAGSFERHGRTLVFVPDRLAAKTVYTVTLRRGVPLAGTTLTTESDLRVQFETGAGGAAPAPRVELTIGRAVLETSPREAPVVGISMYTPEGTTRPSRLTVGVDRLPSLDAALQVLATLRAAPSWARWRTEPAVATAGLVRVASFTAAVETLADSGGGFVRFPSRLPGGWYLATVSGAGRPEQAILQVTDVATYAVASVTRSTVWVNDLATGAPIEGAEASLTLIPAGADAGGAPSGDPSTASAPALSLGRTDADGLLRATTPPAILATTSSVWTGDRITAPVMVITAPDGRQAFVPFAVETDPSLYPGDISNSYWDPATQYWRLLYTDRTLYRTDDELNAWGLVRERDTDRVPAGAELRLRSAAGWGSEAPPVVSQALQPGQDGSFAATLALRDLPLGSYYLQLWAGGRQLASTWIQVGVIRKPTYQLDVTTDRRACIAGDAIRVEVEATFYDGTQVPDADVRVSGIGSRQVTTDGSGRAAFTARMPAPEMSVDWPVDVQWDHWSDTWITARAAGAEEGDISAATQALTFPAAVYLDATGSIAGNRLLVTGSVHRVDLSAVERQLDAGAGTVDPRGAAVAGTAIQVRVIEQVPTRRVVGHSYDFVNKRSVDVYEYDIDERDVATRTVTSSAAGSFTLSVPLTAAGHDYRIVLTAHDAAGRAERVAAWATGSEPATVASYPVLEADASCTWVNTRYHLGQAMRLTMRDQYGPMASGALDRYLFVTAQRGAREAVVQASPTFATTFGAADAPNLSVIGVRFTGTAYIVARNVYHAAIDTGDRQLAVTLATDAHTYEPGGTVTLEVRTADAAGHPVPATVTLRAVDEKLFTSGGASEADPLGDLYATVADGLLYSYTSHLLPAPPPGGGCGSTGGGRDDFRDTVLFRQLRTDASGRGRVTFSLSDDLTAWHVSASAVSPGLEAGEASILVPVGLPFFVEPTLAAEYLAGDRPSLGLRAYGSALRAGDRVTFTVSSTSLAMAALTVTGAAFATVAVPLPALAPGEHAITISATGVTGTNGSTPLADRITRTFRVVESRLTEASTAYATLVTGARPAGGPGLTTYTFADAGRGRYVPLLEALASAGGTRLDQALAQAWARDLLNRTFGRDPGSLPPATFDPTRYQRPGAGLALLPYGSPDGALDVRLALLAPQWFNADDLASALAGAFGTSDEAARTREQNTLVLAGRAALGGATLADVRSALAQPGLTIREQLYLALAAEALGDDPTARSIERDLLVAHGEELGAWVRLRVGTTFDDTVEATALLALVAAGLGDPVAAAAEAYVADNPATDELFVLHELAYVQRVLDRTPSAAARFAWTVDGIRQVIELEPGESRTIALTATQRASLKLEALGGQVGVATRWDVPLDVASTRADATLGLVRTVRPVRQGGSLYEVTLRATFAPQALDGPYQVVDLLPSGLAATTLYAAWAEARDATEASPSPLPSAEAIISWPYAVEGQRVLFSIGPTSTRRTVTMRYLARVVTAGNYAWEPAVLQSVAAPQSVVFTPQDVRITL